MRSPHVAGRLNSLPRVSMQCMETVDNGKHLRTYADQIHIKPTINSYMAWIQKMPSTLN